MGRCQYFNKGWNMSKGRYWLSEPRRRSPYRRRRHFHRIPSSEPGCRSNVLRLLSIDANSKLVRRVSAPDFDYREMGECVRPPGPAVLSTRWFRGGGPEQPEVVAGLRLLARLGLQAVSENTGGARQIRVHEVPEPAVADEGKSEEYEADLRLLQDTARAPGRAGSEGRGPEQRVHFDRPFPRSKRYLLGLKKLYKGYTCTEESLRPHGRS